MPGATVSDGKVHLEKSRKLQEVDYVVIGLGTNDIRASIKANRDKFRYDLVNLINQARKVYLSAKVCYVAIMIF